MKRFNKTTTIHNTLQTKHQTHSNFCTFKFRVCLILYTRLFMKLNLFKILLYVTFLTMKIPDLRYVCWKYFMCLIFIGEGYQQKNLTLKISGITVYINSGIARPGPTRACALPSTFQALPSRAKQESRDSVMN